MKNKYVYLFTIGNSIQWSGETKDTLINRADNQDDKDLILDFIDADSVGSFIKLSTGDFVFQIL